MIEKREKINQKKKDSLKCQKEAAAKYNKENIIQVKFSFNKKTDADIIKHLQPMYNKTSYIKQLIRNDIKKGGKNAN